MIYTLIVEAPRSHTYVRSFSSRDLAEDYFKAMVIGDVADNWMASHGDLCSHRIEEQALDPAPRD